MISDILDAITEDLLKEALIKILAYVDVNDMEASHRLGESDQNSTSKKIIILSSARKQCEKTLANMRKLASIDSQKCFFRRNNKLFIFFKLEFTQCKAEQPLQGTKLRKKSK